MRRDARRPASSAAPASWPAYPLGWTDVSSTPFRLYKTTTMNGGIRVPIVVHWPAGIARARARSAHAVDARHRRAADDARRARRPRIRERFDGHPHARAGRRRASRRRCATRRRATARDAAALRARRQPRLHRDGWKIVSLQPPGKPMDLDNWMLFDLVADATETQRPRAATSGRCWPSSSRRSTPMRAPTTSIRSTTATCAARSRCRRFSRRRCDAPRTFYPERHGRRWRSWRR